MTAPIGRIAAAGVFFEVVSNGEPDALQTFLDAIRAG